MVAGASFPHSPNAGTWRARLIAILLISLTLVTTIVSVRSQSPPTAHRIQRTDTVAGRRQSPFAQAETLLQQGSVDEAKQKIQEQLALNSSSVEGYNLLGIVYTGEKDYDNAQEAFQQALKIAPNSTKTPTILATSTSHRETGPGGKGIQKSSPRRSLQPRRQLQSRSAP